MRFPGGIRVQHRSDLPNQPIHQFLPFGSSGLARCRRDLVDPQECEFRLSKFLANILKTLTSAHQPMDRQFKLREPTHRRRDRSFFISRFVVHPHGADSCFPWTTVTYRMEAAAECKLRGRQGNFSTSIASLVGTKPVKSQVQTALPARPPNSLIRCHPPAHCANRRRRPSVIRSDYWEYCKNRLADINCAARVTGEK